jgi:CRISPR system Cascade subunit CasE
MYLSRLTVSDRSSQMARALSDTHAMHRFLLSAFPDATEGGMGRVLYRVERTVNPRDVPTIIVQSEKEPDVSLWTERVAVDGPKLWTPSLVAGQNLRFRLRANPTVKRRFDEYSDRPGHRRVGLYKEDEQREWLERKAGDHGFALLDYRTIPLGQQGGRKVGNQAAHSLVHLGVDFEGILQVKDVEKLHLALAGGIGSAKGFGFGLLSIARF